MSDFNFSNRFSRLTISRSDWAILFLAVSDLFPAASISRLRAFTCTLNFLNACNSFSAFLTLLSTCFGNMSSAQSLSASFTSTAAAPSAASAASSRLRAVANNLSALSRSFSDRLTNFSPSRTSLSEALNIAGVDPFSC